MANLRWTQSHARCGQGIESCVGSLARQVLLDAERYHIDLGLARQQPQAKRRRMEGAVQPCTPTEGILAKILSAGCPEVVIDQPPGPGVLSCSPSRALPGTSSAMRHTLELTGAPATIAGFHC